MYNLLTYIITILLCCVAEGRSFAQESSADERRALISRDVCVGIAANFASANDGDITFQAGHFRVEKAHGSVTVFEGAVRVTEIPGFTYLSYNDCPPRSITSKNPRRS